MLDIIDKIIETINNCLNRVACQCHSHLCSCFDISVDIIRENSEALEGKDKGI